MLGTTGYQQLPATIVKLERFVLLNMDVRLEVTVVNARLRFLKHPFPQINRFFFVSVTGKQKEQA
jgi:hypothetical protein